MKRLASILLTAAFLLASRGGATASPGLTGEWACFAEGVSVNWFQDIWFRSDDRYALGESRKPYGPGTYRIDSHHVIHFLSGGDHDFLGLYKNNAIYLKLRTDSGPFEKRGFNVTFKCGRGH